MTDIEIFKFDTHEMRFGMTEDGQPYVVAADFAKALDYRDAANALRLLDEDEKGTQIVSTLGGNQSMKVIYEDGMWELIFRSTKPEAKVIKKQVKEILRQLRETGVVDTRQKPMTELEMARQYVAALEAIEAAQPAIEFHETVTADSETWYTLEQSAKELYPATGLGRNTLMDWMRGKRYLTQANLPAQHLINAGKARTATDVAANGRTYTYALFNQAGIAWLLKKFNADNAKD